MGKTLRIPASIPRAGAYSVALTYAPAAESMLEHLLELEVEGGSGGGNGGESGSAGEGGSGAESGGASEDASAGGTDSGGGAVTALVPSIWIDAETRYVVDGAGNEYSPKQRNLLEPVSSYLLDYDSVNRGPIAIELPAGESELLVRNISEDLIVYGAFISPAAAPPSYADYYAAESAARGGALGSDTVVIEAENYSARSDPFITSRGHKELGLHPYDTYRKLLNLIDGQFWYTSGKKVLWEFAIEDAGFYRVSLDYAQEDETAGMGLNMYREAEIDGQVPFAELGAAPFPYTGKGNFQTAHLRAGGGDALIWLGEGRHTIALTATTGPQAEIIGELKQLMTSINGIGMDLKKLSAGTADRNRTWDMDAYMPHAVPALNEFAGRADALYERLWQINGDEPTVADSLLFASATLRKLAKSARTLPNSAAMLSEGDMSVTAALGDVLNQLTRQFMSLDRIVIYGETPLEEKKPSAIDAIGEGIHQLAYSFSPASNNKRYVSSGGAQEPDEGQAWEPGGGQAPDEAGTLDVWVNRPTQYSETLASLAGRDYRSPDGLNVSVMSLNDINKLILTNASGTNPDIVIGLQYEKLYDFAVRGAALELTQFDGFLESYAEHYSMEGLMPVSYDGKVYGVVDSNKLRLLFYRSDILDALGLEVPQTWDDVRTMMPTLLRYSMNFSLPLVNEVGNRTLDMTGPFYFQHGGAFYAPDGASAALGTEAAIEGFTEMADLFRVYGMRRDIANFFNSFRFGELPVGIADEQTYVQLQLAAPELAGKWGVAMVPGALQEGGEIWRHYPVAATACMIFSNTDKAGAAYDFLAWWLSTETQALYAYTLQATYGPEFYWNPSNWDAMAQLGYPPEHMEVIFGQWAWEKENARHPAGYMVERQVSDAWNKVVVESKNKMVSIDYAKLVSDREITRKLQEFGYLDEDGNVLKEFVLDTPALLERELGAGTGAGAGAGAEAGAENAAGTGEGTKTKTGAEAGAETEAEAETEGEP